MKKMISMLLVFLMCTALFAGCGNAADTDSDLAYVQNKGKLIKLAVTDHIDGMAALADAFTVRQKWYQEIGEQLRNE